MNFIKNFFISTFYMLLLFFTQILVLKIFSIGSYFYIMFVLKYPHKWNKYIFLCISFLFGWIIDHCMNTMGFHAFSTTLCAFLRPYFIRLFNGNHFVNKKDFSVYHLSFFQKIIYIFSIITLHNISLWTLETFKNIHNFHSIFFLRKILISVFTTILCIIYFLFRRI